MYWTYWAHLYSERKWMSIARGHGTTFGRVNGDETTLELVVLYIRHYALFELVCAKTDALCLGGAVRAQRR